MNDKKKTLAICLIILILAQFILFVIYFSEEQHLYSFVVSSNVTLGFRGLLTAVALGACVDAVLALSIVVLLHRRRSEIPFSRTSSMIDRIMVYAVGSGLLTAAFALASLITLVTMPLDPIWLVLLEMLPKCESIC